MSTTSIPQPPNIPIILTIGVLTRGKYGRRLLDTLATHTQSKVTSADIPSTLPHLIDEPTTIKANTPSQSNIPQT